MSDLSPASWIAPRLHPFGQDAGSIIPEGFTDYARVLHPASRHDRPVTWREIAHAMGRAVHAEAQFGNVAGAWGASSRPEIWTAPPPTGHLTRELAAALVATLRLHTATPDRCWFAVWEGWGALRTEAPRFEHPGRRYHLATGSIDDATRGVYEDPPFGYQSASMWWPDDRAWFVSTEIDLDSTYVGGTRECIDALLAGPEIEALRARLSDDVTIASDRVNPPVPLPYTRTPSALERLRRLVASAIPRRR